MKYQLAIFWKDGSASGRVIELDWPLAHDLNDVERVVIGAFGKPIPFPALNTEEPS